jgi:copper homeostasis protein
MEPTRKDQPPLLEVCVGSLEDALSAEAAGADRLELCGALELGGLTPSIGLVERVLEEVRVPVVAMVRPRAAGFAYTPSEFRCIVTDAQRLLDAGVAGIVFGMLDPTGQIDEGRVEELVAVASRRETVFHKAFDSIENLDAALVTLIGLGVKRVLTSGGAPTAHEGSATLGRLVRLGAGRIEVLPGGGVTASGAASLLSDTGCTALHIGASVGRLDASTTPQAAASLCDLARLREGAYRAVDPAIVADVRQAMCGRG